MTREEEAAYHSRRMADQIERATAAIAAGSFTSAARQKEALGHLNSAYEHLRSMAHGVAVQAGWDRMPEGARIAEWTDAEQAILDMPFGLHQWRPKHSAACPEQAEGVESLLAMRDEIKAMPIDPRPVREDHPLLIEARKEAGVDLAALRDRRVKQYQDALDFGRTFGGLPVGVTRVWCRNYAGTVWVRLDWHMNGRRVPFNTIAAAYDKLVREGSIIEED
jgi:hypothetical protein